VSVSDPGPTQSGSPQQSSTPAAAPGAAQAPAAGDRPSWLPEKFKTPEALVESYKALEKKLGGDPAQAAQQPSGDLTLAPPPKPTVTSSQLLDEAYGEFTKAEGNVISDATYARLAAAGLDRATVDRSIAGTQALVTSQRTEVHTAVGGSEHYAAVQSWANNGGVTPAEMTAYNNIMRSGDLNAMKIAAAGLAARHAQANGIEGVRVGGVPAVKVAAGPQPFKSTAEQSAAINDPRYRNDPAYRKEIEARIMVTP